MHAFAIAHLRSDNAKPYNIYMIATVMHIKYACSGLNTMCAYIRICTLKWRAGISTYKVVYIMTCTSD